MGSPSSSSSSSSLTDPTPGTNVEGAGLALTVEPVGVSIDSLSLEEVLVPLRAEGGSWAPPPLKVLEVSLSGGVLIDSLSVEPYSVLSGVRMTPPWELTVLVASLSAGVKVLSRIMLARLLSVDSVLKENSRIDAESLGAMEEAVDDPAMLMPANWSACLAMVMLRSAS